MPDDIADGFARISGKRSPPRNGQRYFIQLRCGFVDRRISYTAEQLVWKHDGQAGDIIAVKKAGGTSARKDGRQANGSFE